MPILHFFLHLTMNCVPSLPLLNPNVSPPNPNSLHPPRVFAHPPHLISPLHLVTMQIYLSPLARKTGSSEAAKSATAVPASGGPPAPQQAKGGSKPQERKSSPSFTLNLRKTTNSQNTAQEECSYKSPIKSPSQYFQICY